MKRLQFNSSTLKVSYNAVTSKVQMAGKDCTYCAVGATPLYCRVIFTGLVSCSGCYSNPFSSYTYNVAVGSINGVSFDLPQTEPCKWYKNFGGTWGTGTCWNQINCVGGTETGDMYDLEIGVEKLTNTTMYIWAALHINLTGNCTFVGSTTVFTRYGATGMTDCITIAAATNFQTNCALGTTICCVNGFAQVIEL